MNRSKNSHNSSNQNNNNNHKSSQRKLIFQCCNYIKYKPKNKMMKFCEEKKIRRRRIKQKERKK